MGNFEVWEMLGAVLICSNWLVALLPPRELLCDVSMLTV